MALKTDDKPGQIYDPENNGLNPKPDGSHDSGAISAGEQAKFDQIEAGERDVASKEKNASSSDGNNSSTDSKEKGFYNPTVDPDKKSFMFKMTKKRTTISGFVGGGIASAVIAGLIAFPGFLITQIGDILTGVGDVQISHDRRYRRSNYHRISDVFSRDGRLGGRMITEMQQAGYRVSFDPNNQNRIVGITRPGGRVSATGAGIADELVKFQDARHPFRLSSFKTRRMEAFYNRYGIARKSLITPEAGPGRVSPDAIADINKRLKAAVDGTDLDTTSSRVGATDGLTDEEIAESADNADRLSKNSGIFKELNEFTASGGKLTDFPDQNLVKTWQDSGGLINPRLINAADDIASSGSLGGKAFSTIKGVGVSTDILDKLCIVKKRLQTAVVAARLYRSVSMLRYSYAYMTAPDGVRKGEAQANLLKEVMKRIMAPDSNGNYFGSSSGISYAMKGTFSKSRNDVTRSSIAVDAKLTGALKTIQQKTDIDGCRLWQNPAFQIGVAAGEIALTAITFGGFGAAKQVVSTGTREVVEAGFKASIKNAIRSNIVKSIARNVAIEISFEGIMTLVQIYAERSLSSNFMGQEQGGELSDILIGGGGVGAKQRSLQNGQIPATTTQYGDVLTAYRAEKQDEIRQQSVFARFFDRQNHDSLAFKTASHVAVNLNSPQNTISNIQNSMINSPTTIASTLLNVGSGRTYAEGANNEFDDDQIAFDTLEIEGKDNAGTKLATDPAGNLLTFMPDDIISIDPELNKEELIDLGYVDATTEQPIGAFAKHVELCVDGIDTITQIEAWDGEGSESDCLAKLPLTKKFKAHLAYLGAVDSLEAEFFPEEISEGGAIAQQPISTGGTTLDFPGLNGYAIPCQGLPTPVIRTNPSSPRAIWTNIESSGVIGEASNGDPIHVYIREACPGAADVKTVFIASSIHASENGGQLVSHELLFNADLPDNIRIVAVPEINPSGIFGDSVRPRVNANGVNLNRNFDYNWSSVKQASPPQDNYNYKGSAPESEPETRAMVDFLNSIGAIDLALHYHDGTNPPYVAAAGRDTPLSFASIYGGITPDTRLRVVEEGRVFQPGSFDGWQNKTMGTPALLIEMSSDQSSGIIKGHVDAVKAVLASIN